MKATTQQADSAWQRRLDAWAYGRELRDELLRAYELAYRPVTMPPPALIVDELLRDFLDVRLHYDPLPLTTFAKTEIRDDHLVVTVNTLTSQIHGVKDERGVQNVAKWHEAIHCQKDQEVLRAPQGALFEGFCSPGAIACYRGNDTLWRSEDRTREFFAEEAGRAAAVSYTALALCPSFRMLIQEAGRQTNTFAWKLLYKSADFIGVNVTALVTQLQLEGWIRVEQSGGKQHLYVQRGLTSKLESW